MAEVDGQPSNEEAEMRHQASFEPRVILTRPNRKVVVFRELQQSLFPGGTCDGASSSPSLAALPPVCHLQLLPKNPRYLK